MMAVKSIQSGFSKGSLTCLVMACCDERCQKQAEGCSSIRSRAWLKAAQKRSAGVEMQGDCMSHLKGKGQRQRGTAEA